MPPIQMARSRNRFRAVIACVVMSIAPVGHAQAVPAAAAPVQGPDLDLAIVHTTRVQTPEGVLRESRYEEKMMRRQGHVWLERVLPEAAPSSEAAHRHDKTGHATAAEAAGPAHRHFNHVLLPRHVFSAGDRLGLEFIDFRGREIISIAPAEYENVRFDGSWANTFFLVDPKSVSALPVSGKAAPAGARWHELTRDGVYQRVLWDARRMIPLLVETGDTKGSFRERMEVKVQPGLTKVSPWTNLKGYAQKEYADFLD